MTSDTAHQERFGGLGRLYGVQGLDRLRTAHVAVIGVGGVGSWTAEALARSGVGALTMVDMDDVCVTNTNRQVHALDGNIGRPKVEAMAERIARIHPACRVDVIPDFFTEKTADGLLDAPWDAVVDAIDQPHHKALLIARCVAMERPIITVGGAGGRRDPSLVNVDDLTEAYNDALLKRVRKRLRYEHGFPAAGTRWGVPCVFSRERPVFPTADGGVCRSGTGGNLKLDCRSGYGTASFVTGTFGFAAASAVVELLVGPPDAPAGS